MKRICMWSGPRNVSTAVMYAFAQRTDTRVVDEPLYGHYLRVSGAEHPGRKEILATMDQDGERVVNETILGPCDCEVLFIKNMAHHLVDLDLGFLTELTNIFLIRDPLEMLPSLINQLPQPTLHDTALGTQSQLLQRLHKAGQNPPILDSKELLLNPERVLNQLCDRIELPFESGMLSWSAGPRPEDGVWARYWYHNVHKSTAFQEYRVKIAPFPEPLKSLLEECQPFYDVLYAKALKAN